MTNQKSINITEQYEEAVLSCPVGESSCGVIDEALALRKEIDDLTEQISKDTLTGLYNFRHFRLSLEQEMERTRRTGQPTLLIMLDLDHFKLVNDTWGHEVGNQALISTSLQLQEVVRRLDIPCRYGGEEFALILPATDLLIGLQVAERIRANIESTPVMVGGKNIQLTASLGVDLYNEKQDDTPEQLVARVDKYLYEAKQAGRNRVCHGTVEVISSAASVSKEERDLLSGFFGQGEGEGEGEGKELP